MQRKNFRIKKRKKHETKAEHITNSFYALVKSRWFSCFHITTWKYVYVRGTYIDINRKLWNLNKIKIQTWISSILLCGFQLFTLSLFLRGGSFCSFICVFGGTFEFPCLFDLRLWLLTNRNPKRTKREKVVHMKRANSGYGNDKVFLNRLIKAQNHTQRSSVQWSSVDSANRSRTCNHNVTEK